jgi:hypothetical protein
MHAGARAQGHSVWLDALTTSNGLSMPPLPRPAHRAVNAAVETTSAAIRPARAARAPAACGGDAGRTACSAIPGPVSTVAKSGSTHERYLVSFAFSGVVRKHQHGHAIGVLIVFLPKRRRRRGWRAIYTTRPRGGRAAWGWPRRCSSRSRCPLRRRRRTGTLRTAGKGALPAAPRTQPCRAVRVRVAASRVHARRDGAASAHSPPPVRRFRIATHLAPPFTVRPPPGPLPAALHPRPSAPAAPRSADARTSAHAVPPGPCVWWADHRQVQMRHEAAVQSQRLATAWRRTDLQVHHGRRQAEPGADVRGQRR